MCCAPCAIYPVKSILQNKDNQITGLYYNPNIHPYEEFVKREENIERLASMEGFLVHYMPDYNEDLWLALKENDDKKCRTCYEMRLSKTFKYAKDNGYDAATTSLLVSPYQKHDLIIEIANKYAKIYDIIFYYEDFRTGYSEGKKMAKGLGLYCQRYCGCILSLKEAINDISNEFKQSRNLVTKWK